MNGEIVYASSVEEFYYIEDDMPVSSGQPIGMDIEVGQEVSLVLFDYIYWSPTHE